jgi:hypothetical protein
MIGFSPLPTAMTAELSNVLLTIDAIALIVFLLVLGSPKIAAGSSRAAKLFRLPALLERFKLWRDANKSR